MIAREVEFTPEAQEDLLELYDDVAEAASPMTAIDYVGRLETFCMGLSQGSERGSLRSEVRKGLRVIGFERRVSIAFVVEENRVVILRLLRKGRDWRDILS